MPIVSEVQPQKPASSIWLRILLGFLVLYLLFLLVSTGYNSQQTDSKPVVEDKRALLAETLDPPSNTPLTPRQHLDTAKRLLSQMNPNDFEKSDVLTSLISKHAQEAKLDPHLKRQAETILKRMADKSVQALQINAWNSASTSITARIVCKTYINDRLKAPASADWISTEAGRWAKHPGYYIVDIVVDAMNSFGGKLRSKYECQVSCLTQNACEVTKLSDIQ
jgi:hypothetical protein